MSSNTSDSNFNTTQDSIMTAANIAVYTIIFIASLTGNLIISIVTVQKKTGRTSIDILIFALAICDLVITVSIPFVAVSFLYESFPYGVAGCKLIGLRNAATYTSAFILLTISLERYYTVFDLSRSRHNLRITMGIISISVIIAFGLTVPQFIALNLENYYGIIYCTNSWKVNRINERIYGLILRIITFAIPFVVITISNIVIYYKLFSTNHNSIANRMRLTAKRQVVGVMVAVSAVFFICLSPIYLSDTLAEFNITITLHGIIPNIFTWIAYSHSIWNPIIYIIGSSRMRKSCKALLKIDQYNCNIH